MDGRTGTTAWWQNVRWSAAPGPGEAVWGSTTAAATSYERRRCGRSISDPKKMEDPRNLKMSTVDTVVEEASGVSSQSPLSSPQTWVGSTPGSSDCPIKPSLPVHVHMDQSNDHDVVCTLQKFHRRVPWGFSKPTDHPGLSPTPLRYWWGTLWTHCQLITGQKPTDLQKPELHQLAWLA